MEKKINCKSDRYYMDMALELAKRGCGSVSPNPMVGCVITKDNKLLSYGWHEYYGGPHAEVNAVRKLTDEELQGATVYVTLEPCSHYGKTPPCAELLKSKMVKRVVAAIVDPNPKVNSSGLEILKNAGIEIQTGLCSEKAEFINRGFLKRIRTGKPWVTLKTASSLDGDISLKNGESKWITASHSRRQVHQLRSEYDALLTGSGTIISDNPEYTVRDTDGHSPVLIILDKRLEIPEDYKVFKVKERKVVIFAEKSEITKEKAEKFLKNNVQVVTMDKCDYNLNHILKEIASMGVNYLMVEAGISLSSSFIESGEADDFILFYGDKFLGNGKHYTDNIDISSMEDSININVKSVDKNRNNPIIRGEFACLQD